MLFIGKYGLKIDLNVSLFGFRRVIEKTPLGSLNKILIDSILLNFIDPVVSLIKDIIEFNFFSWCRY